MVWFGIKTELFVKFKIIEPNCFQFELNRNETVIFGTIEKI